MKSLFTLNVTTAGCGIPVRVLTERINLCKGVCAELIFAGVALSVLVRVVVLCFILLLCGVLAD